MQSSSVLLLNPAAASAKVAASVPNTPGANRPIFLTEAQANELAFRRGNSLARRYLSIFPRKMQVFAGTASAIGLGVGLFFAFRPAPNTGAPDNQTRTPEWERATQQYLEKQRISPAHKKSG